METRDRLYEYAVLFHPRATKEQRDDGFIPPPELLLGPDCMIADSEQTVGMRIARELDEKYLSMMTQVEIKIRPF